MYTYNPDYWCVLLNPGFKKSFLSKSGTLTQDNKCQEHKSRGKFYRWLVLAPESKAGRFWLLAASLFRDFLFCPVCVCVCVSSLNSFMPLQLQSAVKSDRSPEIDDVGPEPSLLWMCVHRIKGTLYAIQSELLSVICVGFLWSQSIDVGRFYQYIFYLCGCDIGLIIYPVWKGRLLYVWCGLWCRHVHWMLSL